MQYISIAIPIDPLHCGYIEKKKSALTDYIGDEKDATSGGADDRPEYHVGNELRRQGDNHAADQLYYQGEEEDRPAAVLVGQGAEYRRAEHHADHERRVAQGR